MTLSFIDAFSGAGGLSLGLHRAGFLHGFAFDNDANAIATHKLNISGEAETLDADLVSGGDLLAKVGRRAREVDLLAGGPPCQGFSLQRRGPRQDDRNRLVLRYLDWLSDIEPRAFLIENVAAIRSVRGSEFIEAVERHATRVGYTLHSKILDASDFGVPQIRRRAFLVGIRNDEPGTFAWPEPTTVMKSTVRQAIGHLPPPPSDGTEHLEIPNHRQDLLTAINIERIRSVPEGGGRMDLPPELRLKCHEGTHRHLDTYGRMRWDAPSGTITARFDSFTRGRFGHPEADRTITLREGALLQTFPEDFRFIGTKVQVARYIGNAVPPVLAEAVGRSIAQALGVKVSTKTQLASALEGQRVNEQTAA